jgi:hypothetical protein
LKEAGPRELDLHGVRARDARSHVVNFVRSVHLVAPGSVVRIITGLGLHSAASPVLHRLVRQMLESKTVPRVASWSTGADGGSFLVCLAGATAPAAAADSARSASRQSDRAWNNARQLEYARRCAEREQAAADEAAAEARRLEALRREYGGRELPDWLCRPPDALLQARAAREEAEEADRVEYRLSRAEFEARRQRSG